MLMSSQDFELFDESIDSESLLIPLEEYLTSGIHIGTTIATKNMKEFIFRVRKDGLYVLDVKKTDDRIRMAGRLLASYDPGDVLVCSARQYGTVPSTKLARLCNFRAILILFCNIPVFYLIFHQNGLYLKLYAEKIKVILCQTKKTSSLCTQLT